MTKVPKSAPESRQSYAGLTLNHATNVVVRDNMVKTELHNDYAFMACCGASIVGDSRDNKVDILLHADILGIKYMSVLLLEL